MNVVNLTEHRVVTLLWECPECNVTNHAHSSIKHAGEEEAIVQCAICETKFYAVSITGGE